MAIDFTPQEIEALLQSVDTLSPAEQAELLQLAEELERRRYVEHCYNDFIAFCKHMQTDYLVGKHHKLLAGLLTDIEKGEKDRVTVSIAPRHGKLLAHSTPVLTPTGWTTHGNLAPGDWVYHPSGVPVMVLAVSEEGLADHEVVISNGETILCHGAHEWAVKANHKSSPTRVVETSWLASVPLWRGERGARGARAVYRLPDTQPIQTEPCVLALHPYILGVWLGDGVSSKPTVTMCREDGDLVKEEFAKFGYPCSVEHVHATTGVVSYNFTEGRAKGRGNASPMRTQLTEIGVLGNKHIPEQYLRASVAQRLELLAGLVDTDGHVEEGTGRVRFVSGCYTLVQGVYDLCTTLGFRPYITKQAPALSSSGIQGKQEVYTVGFQPNMVIPCRLPRKRYSQKTAMRRSLAIVDVSKAEKPELGRCIQVDSPDGLYLAGKTLVPTHNSLLISTLFPAWYLGRNPGHQVLLVSHTADLAVDFGRKVRNLIATDAYREIFPTVHLSADSKSAGRWNTNAGGMFYATGVGSALAGRGAHLLLIDDPHNEQDIINGNYTVFDQAYEWYTYGARTRLMPGGAVCVVATRWHTEDLIGRLIRDGAKNPEADQFEVFEFPAILNEGTDNEKALWPQFFDLPALKRTKASMPAFQWNAQYQQNPTSEEAAVIPREKWQRWKKDLPPDCEYIMMALDAAAEAHNRADYTALVVMGVFFNEETSRNELIVLDSIKKRMEFPELKVFAMEKYKEWQPDAFIVEKKSSGTPLYQEMRRTGVLVQEFTPHRGTGDKLARLNAVADIVLSGLVWVPETRWAEELVEEVAAFPFGRNDDLVDCVSMLLSRHRQGGFLRLPTDERDEERYFKAHRGGRYY